MHCTFEENIVAIASIFRDLWYIEKLHLQICLSVLHNNSIRHLIWITRENNNKIIETKENCKSIFFKVPCNTQKCLNCNTVFWQMCRVEGGGGKEKRIEVHERRGNGNREGDKTNTLWFQCSMFFIKTFFFLFLLSFSFFFFATVYCLFCFRRWIILFVFFVSIHSLLSKYSGVEIYFTSFNCSYFSTVYFSVQERMAQLFTFICFTFRTLN